MLPPQLRQGVRPRGLTKSHVLTAPSTPRRLTVLGCVAVPSPGSHLVRTCFGWHRKYDRGDPRLRHRIIKAKLLQSLHNRSPHALGVRSLGWRLGSSLGRSRQTDDTENEAARTNKNDTGQLEDRFPYELSEKEKHWRQRVDHIKRWIDEDPYQAMFGWSNRLRRGQPLRGWPFGNMPAWWREEMGFAKDKISNEAREQPKPDEAEASQPKSDVKVETQESGPKAQTSAERTSPPRIFIRRSIDEPPLEYDPISNRMIRKGDNAFSHYAQELDVDEASAKPPRPDVYPRKVPIRVIRDRPKPSQTAIEPKDPRKGSLTPYKSSTVTNVRAEYEAYKAQRLGEIQIQETEKTIEAGRQALEATQRAQEEAAERRAKLEEDFEKAQLKMVEHDLLSLTPYKVQRSKGTVLESSTDAMAAESGGDVLRLHPNFKPVHDRRKVLLMELDDVDVEDKRVKQQINALQKRIDPADKDVGILEQKLERLWMKRKALEKQRAELNDKLREVRWTEPQEPEITPGHYKSVDAQISKGLETALQRHSKDKISSPSAERPTEDPTVKDEPYGYEHARESVKGARLAGSPTCDSLSEHPSQKDLGPNSARNEVEKWLDKFKRMFVVSREPKEPTAEDIYKQRQEEAAKSILDEEVNQQKLAMRKMEDALKKPLPSVAVSDSVSLPDLDSIQKRAAEEVAKKEQKARDAELVREIRSAYENEYGPITTHHRQVNESKTEGDKSILGDAIKPETVESGLEESKAGSNNEERLSAFSLAIAPKKAETETEVSSTPSAPRMTVTNETTESKPSTERSPSTVSSVPQESSSESISDSQAKRNSTDATKPIPEAELTDVNAITTSYAILAYDHTTASVTRATISAPPNSMETPMPLTVALTQLTHPAKFLPYLQSLKERGFVPVSCSNSLLILRRTGSAERRPKAVISEEATNEKLVNPIDKTGNGAAGGAHVPTGDFASPTGFVNYGVLDDHPSSSSYHNQVWEHRYGSKHHEHHVRNGHRRPRRLENVFSGGYKVQKPWNRRRERRRWKRWAKNIAASFGLAVAVVYVAGIIVEMRREMRKVSDTDRTDDRS